jgi:ABC-type Fe3+ transport system permease subunit
LCHLPIAVPSVVIGLGLLIASNDLRRETGARLPGRTDRVPPAQTLQALCGP